MLRNYFSAALVLLTASLSFGRSSNLVCSDAAQSILYESSFWSPDCPPGGYCLTVMPMASERLTVNGEVVLDESLTGPTNQVTLNNNTILSVKTRRELTDALFGIDKVKTTVYAANIKFEDLFVETIVLCNIEERIRDYAEIGPIKYVLFEH